MAKKARKYWLLKSEPDSYSIDDLARDKRTGWDGVRNFQARNIMRDEMQVGDLALFHHSGAKPPGAAGVAEIASAAKADFTALDSANDHFDPKATAEEPIWMLVDVAFVAKFPSFVTMDAMRKERGLKDMMVLARGSMLSVQPVTARQFEIVCALGGWKP